ncbi:hypothetical protein [Lysinibacillus odysseyi]|uniref:hypothetical protein n=1 Tax=Lysinibacillus odysseyi TaxID=202611 RepID=UPI000AA6123A|nr:hypothetical protein [Lysinibacillus odysseyi]
MLDYLFWVLMIISLIVITVKYGVAPFVFILVLLIPYIGYKFIVWYIDKTVKE